MSEKFNVLINEERLQNRIKEIARQIENKTFSIRVNYWQKRVLEIIGGAK